MKYLVYTGDLAEDKFFASRDEAKTYINELLGIAKNRMEDSEGHYPSWTFDLCICEVTDAIAQNWGGEPRLKEIKSNAR